jgi:superfamily II DNA/RNA helicase
MTTFQSLGVAEDLAESLAGRGITEPFPIQLLTIPDALAGRDVCGKAKTGSGKTLAFGLPILQRLAKAKPGLPTALVLVPTRELAVQVNDELAPLAKSRGSRVHAIYGGADIDAQINAINSGVEMIVATPGRLIDLIERRAIALRSIDHVVIDEADRMADMGFMPQVEWVLRHIEGDHQTLLFSATLDGAVDGLVRRYQEDPAMHEVDSKGVSLDEMLHRFIQVHQMDKPKVAGAIANNVGRTLMFVRTKIRADKLVKKLTADGVNAEAIHGDLRQNARERALRRFSSGEIQVLVATDVAARGIHVDDIDVVIHYDPAPEHKTYLHRSGRTARAGDSGVVVTLVLWNEELEVRRVQKRLSLDMPIVEMFSNDDRLTDLAAWEPVAEVTGAASL